MKLMMPCWRLALVGATVVAYDTLLRPWMQDWGATAEERVATLPGDDIIQDAMSHYARAVTIDAPPEPVWPWLVQIGDRRTGFYSYDWIERFVFGGTVRYVERTHSAAASIPSCRTSMSATGSLPARSSSSPSGARPPCSNPTTPS
jgi:hypothetical protein